MPYRLEKLTAKLIMTMNKKRCPWPSSDKRMIRYHDEEWGVPIRDDNKLFEFILLDTFQAGLSWSIILNRRQGFSEAFDKFDPEIIASYNESKIQSLLVDKGIIRNKLKINSTVSNARIFLYLQEKHDGFHNYIWEFTNGAPILNNWQQSDQIPATSKESDIMSKAFKKAGFKFAGSTICYSIMQAAGLVNDHLVSCFRYPEVQNYHWDNR